MRRCGRSSSSCVTCRPRVALANQRCTAIEKHCRKEDPMKWSARANRKLVDAIIAAFHDSAEESYTRLFSFDERDWERTYHWFDASGMALYFLDLVERLHIQTALPVATLVRLRQN